MQTSTRQNQPCPKAFARLTRMQAKMQPCSSFLRQQFLHHRSPFVAASTPRSSRRHFVCCKAMEQHEGVNKDEHGLHQPVNPSNQQPTEAGKEGAKASGEFMFDAYGDKYASRCVEEGFGHRGGEETMDPFHQNVRGDVAEELGVPELKNRGKTSDSKEEDPKSTTPTTEQDNAGARIMNK